MDINVTQNHIDQGRVGSGQTCALALAIRQAFENCEEPMRVEDMSVGGGTAYVQGWSKTEAAIYLKYGIDPNLLSWIRDFDQDRSTVKPITVEIRPGIGYIPILAVKGGEEQC